MEATSGFFLLLAWLNYLDRDHVVPLGLTAGLLHELGHYGAVRAAGGNVRLIRLTAIGAEMILDHPLDYRRELAAVLAGPAVNLLLAALFCRQQWGVTFAGLNLALGCFNLLPVGRLDGGRALTCLVSLLSGPGAACRVRERLDGLCAVSLLAAGLWLAGAGGNITLLLTALWLAVNFLSEKKKQFGACHAGWKRVQ